MGKLNVTSGGGLRVGPGTSIRMHKIQSIISLADNKDFIGTAAELADRYGYKSPATISSAIAILRELGYDIANLGRMGYVVKARPDRFPKEFEHFRSGAKVKLPSSNGTQLAILETTEPAINPNLCIDKLDKPNLPHFKPFGRGVFIAQDDWVKFLNDTEKIYNEYSSIVDVFNMA